MNSSALLQVELPIQASGFSDKHRTLYNHILKTRITDKTAVKRLTPVVTIAGSTYARRGDFSVVMGQRKAGKTTVLQFVAATALMEHLPNDLDTLQIRSLYCEGKDVIYVDTEGSQEDTKDFLEGVKRIIGTDELPANFYAYHWRESTQKECRESLDFLFKHVHTKSHLWIIDGIADLVSKPNDEAESNETVRWIMNNAGRLDTCLILVIHENAARMGQETKSRGHLGSELERKASGAIGIEKDKQEKCHYLKSRFLRKSEDFEPIRFSFDKAAGRPVSRILTAEEKQQLTMKDFHKRRELQRLVQQCFVGVTAKTKTDLLASIKLYQDSSPTKEAERKKATRNLEALLQYGYLKEFTNLEGETVYEHMRGQPDNLIE